MHQINQIYINGQFVTPHGEELFDLFNPATARRIGQVRLADERDALNAISAAKAAFPLFSRTTKSERVANLRRMHAAITS
ncbi:aldehyde dehydrogenase family protein, partial [Pseudomonas tolaasii]